jgi:hypothetical protein
LALALGTVLLGAALAAAGADASGPSGDERVDRAVQAATRFLLGRIEREGKCLGEPPEEDPRFGGKTALCVHALLTAGVEPEKSAPLARAIAWLGGAKPHGTYAVAMRANAWALLRDPRSRELLEKDTAWLIEAMNDEGGYTYTSCGGKPGESQDNSNAQMALLGVLAGARRGVEVPRAYWSRVEKYWIAQQQLDGGWGYRSDPRTHTARTYGSMTAAGLASLYTCFDQLRTDQFIRCAAAAEYEPIERGLAWLGRHFRADENPRKGVEWYTYWLYGAARVGLASGHKYFAAHDWYAEGRRALLGLQNPDGSWGYGDSAADTAFALMFIARGRHPIVISKLRYPGRWNPRPRDAANLSRWISTTFERPVGWQIVNLDSPPADWHEAPILYLSGAGPIELTAGQIEKVRTYVYQLIRLPETHAIYSAHFDANAGARLSGVSNGVRLLAVHAPRELSLAMQLGPRKAHLPIYELLANIYVHSTDRGKLRPRGSTYWPVAGKIQPRATIRLARLRHNGNCDPEPFAWRRLSILLANRHKVRLDVSPPVDISKLDAADRPVAHMTGTDAFDLSGAEADALKRYFRAGGTLLVDAAGGSRIFSETVAERIYPLAGAGRSGELAHDHPLYLKGPFELKEVRYRRDYAQTLSAADRTRARLRVVLRGERLAVIHSREDLTFGLLGAPAFKLKGYTPDSAEKLVTNILFHLAKMKAK